MNQELFKTKLKGGSKFSAQKKKPNLKALELRCELFSMIT